MNWFYANQTILTAVMTSDFVATPPARGSRHWFITYIKARFTELVFWTGAKWQLILETFHRLISSEMTTMTLKWPPPSHYPSSQISQFHSCPSDCLFAWSHTAVRLISITFRPNHCNSKILHVLPQWDAIDIPYYDNMHCLLSYQVIFAMQDPMFPRNWPRNFHLLHCTWLGKTKNSNETRRKVQELYKAYVGYVKSQPAGQSALV